MPARSSLGVVAAVAVDALLEGRRRIARFEPDRLNQQVREGVQHEQPRAGEADDARLARLLAVVGLERVFELLLMRLDRVERLPGAHCVDVEGDEDALAEDLYRWQPPVVLVAVIGQRRGVDGAELDLALGVGGGAVEARECELGAHLGQVMRQHDAIDEAGQIGDVRFAGEPPGAALSNLALLLGVRFQERPPLRRAGRRQAGALALGPRPDGVEHQVAGDRVALPVEQRLFDPAVLAQTFRSSRSSTPSRKGHTCSTASLTFTAASGIDSTDNSCGK